MSRSYDHNAPRGKGSESKLDRASRKQRRPAVAYQAMRDITPRLSKADLHKLVGFNWGYTGNDD